MILKNREKLIICALFLSKFDCLAYQKLGFSSFIEAFNVLGYALGGKPSSIKNYRDEFDPYFDNERKGWHKRQMREYCSNIYEKYKDMEFIDFYELICSFINPNFFLEKEIFNLANIENKSAKRLATGLAAEQFFMDSYRNFFVGFSLKDMRMLSCGFDFKLDDKQDFYCVEVKGMREKNGNFLLTQKEFEMARSLQERYCLFIVSNFKETPRADIFFNPLQHFTLKEQREGIIRFSYQGMFNAK